MENEIANVVTQCAWSFTVSGAFPLTSQIPKQKGRIQGDRGVDKKGKVAGEGGKADGRV
jgi:hypothetical protein